jgi:rubrerythrin
MAVTFNADEIFEMAEEIERNGAKFYREAARNASDGRTKKMLLDLAAMEDGHLKVFQQIRKDLKAQEKEQAVFDPDNEGMLYLQAMADSHGTEGKKSVLLKLTGRETIKEVLETAVVAEKDSVVYYTGLKELVPAGSAKDRVDTIIREEMGHLAILKLKLAELE